jgi:catechol 2,3-dioxygenase-like lactoylglutathione lyase family enzyme
MISGGVVFLPVADVAQAVRFYVETLGMKLVEEGANGEEILDAGEGFRIGLRQRPAGVATRDHAPEVGLYPKLPIREVVAILENRGVAFDVEEADGVVVARFRDPDENRLCLRQPR